MSGWTKLKNTVKCSDCKAFYLPKLKLENGKWYMRCPRCGSENWIYIKEEE